MTLIPRKAGALPHNAGAERSVLGAVLVDAALFPRVAAILSPADFYKSPNQKIFVAMVRLAEAGIAIDMVTLLEELTRAGDLDTAGGPANIGSLVEGVPRSANVEWY